MRPWHIVLAGFLPLLGPAFAGGAAPAQAPGAGAEKPKPLALHRLPEAASWREPQFVQADAKGQVFLLRGSPLDVYPLASTGELGKARRLTRLADSTSGAQALAAAMSADGEQWLLQVIEDRRPLALLRDGEEKLVPSPDWTVTDVGFAGSEPLIAVAAVPIAGQVEIGARWEPPFLRAFRGTGWKDLVSEVVPFTKGVNFFTVAKFPRDVLLARGQEGSFWVVQRYAYRARRFSGAGRQLEEIATGGPGIEYRDRTKVEAEQVARIAAEVARSGREPPPGLGGSQVPKKVILAVTVSPLGELYLLVSEEANDGKGLALDRYDPVRGVIERVDLDLAPYSGRRTLAAGRDGLFLANYRGDAGRWWVPWEELDAAPWREVPSARIGSRLEP